ncbi:MAG: DUF488 domain-containing protein [Bacteroidales bacterium]|nr:DUF488 domain-containing protein [Candidatus Colicola equi]
MLYYRRKILLALLEMFGGKLSAIQLQKYLFLFTRNQMTRAFSFVPYKYGCFSFQANQDMTTLGTYGYVEECDNGYVLKNHGNYLAQLDMFDQQLMRNIYDEFGQMSQNELVRHIYVKYPFYAINSTIASTLLSPDEMEKVNAQRPRKSGRKLFTIGYEGVTLEDYLKRLLLEDVHVLCDVRKNAFSQKYGFNKSQLENACKSVGIRYVHVPDLGIESDKRQDLRSQHDYDILFAEYDRTIIPQNQQALRYVYDLILKEERVALTCFEKDPKQCHRSRVAKALMDMANNQYTSNNIVFNVK